MSDSATALKMPIRTVTVMEDRARIVRRGAVERPLDNIYLYTYDTQYIFTHLYTYMLHHK